MHILRIFFSLAVCFMCGCTASPFADFQKSIVGFNSVKITVYSEEGEDYVDAKITDVAQVKRFKSLLAETTIPALKCSRKGSLSFYLGTKKLNQFDFTASSNCAFVSFSVGESVNIFALNDSGYAVLNEYQQLAEEQFKVDILKPLLGNWEHAGSKTKMQESWKMGEKHLFEGRGFELDLKGKVLFSEDLFMEIKDGKIVYAADHGKGPEFFSMDKTGKDTIRFSRPGDDWPNSIQYSFSEKDSMKIILDGMENGKQKRDELMFIKTK